ncbi:hypothetical protein ACFSW8_17400 [Rubritalea tangerina]|uniref:LamG domain-containing protein n=1 Tax=Rubritalea tangerina TaxID=430798 RepID=A0ABW4ZFA3_9BACT
MNLPHSIYKISTSCLLALNCASLQAESRVHLTDDDRISGKLLKIDSEGNAHVQSPHSSAPLIVVSPTIESIDFDSPVAPLKDRDEQLELLNGDTLPCTFDSMDQDSVAITTWFSGDIQVPKNAIQSILFKALPKIYSGPDASDSWDWNHNWKVLPKQILCNGKGEISKNFDTPQNFILDCQVHWQSERPRFRITFCADAAELSKVQDSYFLEFNSNNLLLVRASSTQARATLGEYPIKLRDREHNHLSIGIRVNRQLRSIELLLDGEKINSYFDPSFNIPSGSFVNIESNLQNANESLMLSHLEVSKWNGAPHDDRDRPRKELDHDLIVTSSGDRYSGNILSKKPKSDAINFSNAYDPTPFPVPTEQLQSIHFSNQLFSLLESPASYTLSLQGGGTLSVSQLTFSNDKVQAVHPILGTLTLKPQSLKQLRTIQHSHD